MLSRPCLLGCSYPQLAGRLVGSGVLVWSSSTFPLVVAGSVVGWLFLPSGRCRTCGCRCFRVGLGHGAVFGWMGCVGNFLILNGDYNKLLFVFSYSFAFTTVACI